MNRTTVVPAYGRDYSSAKAAIADWQAGKDFVIQDISNPWDGKPCSVRDGLPVKIRYNRLMDIAFPSTDLKEPREPQ